MLYRKRQEITNDILHGSLWKTIISLALPLAAAMALNILLGLVDMFWVSKLGPEPLAALSFAGVLFFLLITVSQVFATGTAAITARHFGARNYLKVNYVVSQGIFLTAFASLILGEMLFLFKGGIMVFLGANARVGELGAEYIALFAPGFAIQIFLFTINAAFMATGEMRIPLFNLLAVNIVNFFLDPLLIFGYGPLPELGIRGAALATSLSSLIALFLSAYFLLSGRHSITLVGLPKLCPDLRLIKSILRIGIPSFLQLTVTSVGIVTVIRYAAIFGTEVVAALGVTFKITDIAMIPFSAIGAAVGTVVGQSLGAGYCDRAYQGAMASTLLGIGISLVISLAFFYFPDKLLAVFSIRDSIEIYGIELLKIFAFCQAFTAVSFIIGGVFRGAGDTKPPLIFTSIKVLLLIFLPILFMQNTSLGLKGIWYTVLFSWFVEALLLASWFYKGEWQKKELYSKVVGWRI